MSSQSLVELRRLQGAYSNNLIDDDLIHAFLGKLAAETIKDNICDIPLTHSDIIQYKNIIADHYL